MAVLGEVARKVLLRRGGAVSQALVVLVVELVGASHCSKQAHISHLTSEETAVECRKTENSLLDDVQLIAGRFQR